MKALSGNPSFFTALYAIASCHSKLGNYDEAITTYNQAFSLESETATSIQHNDWKSAIGNLTSAGNFQEAATPSQYTLLGKKEASHLQLYTAAKSHMNNTGHITALRSIINHCQCCCKNAKSTLDESRGDGTSRYGKVTIDLNTN